MHAVRVAEGLAARGHQVTVLTSRYRPELPREEVVNGVRVIRLQPIARLSRGVVTPAFPWAAALLIRASDVVQIHTPLPEAPIVAVLCSLLGRPMLMTHHGDVVMPPGLFNQALQWMGYWLTYLAGRLASGVTSYSQDYADHSRLLRHFAEKLTPVLPPVEIPDPDMRAAEAWKTQLGLAGRSIIGFAGRWVSEKGFDDLLRALPIVRNQLPQAQLVFAGERDVVYERFFEQCRPLIEQIRDHITFLGLLNDRQQLANFYGMCDVFALPSRTDNMPLVEIEAMLAGTPVIASDIPGARVVVQKTGYGLLSPTGDPQGLAEALIAGLRRRDGFKPHADEVRRIFDPVKSFDAYEMLLLRMRGEPAPQPAERSARGPFTENGSRPWFSLDAQDQQLLDRLLFNEADMAFRRRARILMDYLELRDGERVIDLGCGMGFYLMLMGRTRAVAPYGLDRERTRLRRAQAEVSAARLVEADLEALPFAPAAFDKILLSEVLEHLVDDADALQTIFRLLKPGGILAISVPHANYPFWWDPINRVWSAIGVKPIRRGPLVGIWTNHERLYRPEELSDRLRQAGFVVEALEQSTHYCFPFIHFLVYGIGKPLLEHELLPKPLAISADRFSSELNRGSYLNPINLGVATFRAFDQANEAEHVMEQTTFVNVLVKARKPERASG